MFHRCYCSLSLHRQIVFNSLVRRTLFGRSSKTEKTKDDDFDEGLAQQEPESISTPAVPSVTELASYKTKQYVSRLVTCRPYTPPSNVEQIVYRLASETIENFQNEETRLAGNWQALPLVNPLSKYHLLTRCMNECVHTISNMTLNDLRTLADVCHYFSTPIKDTNILEELHQSSDLPENVHIQLDAMRFTPETSEFFQGLDAFPKRSTKVIDLWYKKKYPSYPKNEEDPFKDNIY